MTKSVLIYGGAGALGRAMVSAFRSRGTPWRVLSADIAKSEVGDAHLSIPIPTNASIETVSSIVRSAIATDAGDGGRALDAVICVAGGWMGGSASSVDFPTTCQVMLQVNLLTALASTAIASSTLRHGGMLVLTGAQGALRPTPDMLAYGVAKAATHHLITSLSLGVPGVVNSTVIGLLPNVIDTPSNRAGMPTADFTQWTSPSDIADMVVKWAEATSAINSNSVATITERPPSGSMVNITTKDSHTSFKVEQGFK